MKKLKLNDLNLDDAELLSREELKKVLGGMGSGGSGGGSGTIHCMTNFTDYQGITHMTMGDCASQNMNECISSALDNCRHEASMAGGSCTFWTCH